MAKLYAKVRLAAILIAIVCTAAAVTHWRALTAKALTIDDQQYLVKNVLVQNPGWTSAKRFLTEIFEPSTVQGYYQPLTMISLMLDYAAGGRENNLLAFHITNLTLHTANTALIIVLLYMLFGNIWAAASAGLLFSVHPMTVEPIPWVTERKTLLAAFFAFWSLIFYVRYTRDRKKKFYIGCLVMYLLALMSKPTSVPLPAVMLLMDYWPLKRLNKKTILEKLPLFALGTVSAVITYISQTRTLGTVISTHFGTQVPLLILCHNIIFYLYKIILPINLSWYYAFPNPFGLSQPMVAAGVIGTCILIPALLFSLRWTHAVLTGWLIFFTAIFPTMGLVGFTILIAADKYAYLPSIGLLMIVTSFLIWLGKNKTTRIATATAVLVLAGAEAIATVKYLAYWQDSMTLISYMLKMNPDSAPIYNGRGAVYFEQGQYDLAISDFTKSLEINPRYPEALFNLANAYAKSKARYDIAIANYNKALEVYPNYAQAYNERGNAYFDIGDLNSALADYNKALTLNPRYAEAYCNRGTAYAQGAAAFDLAISDFTKAIQLNPKYDEAYNNRGNAYKSIGEYDLAIADYNKAIELNPKYADAYYNRGNAYNEKGQLDFAMSDFKKAIEINPKHADAYNNLGTIYNTKANFDLAIFNFDKAIELNPKLAGAYFNKAVACEASGRKQEAIEAYKNFIQYAPAQFAPHIEQAKQRIKQLK